MPYVAENDRTRWVLVTPSRAAAYLGVVGAPYADADGTAYLSMFGQPVLVMEGDTAVLRAAHERCLHP